MMNPILRMVRRRALIIVVIVVILLLSTQVLHIWQSILSPTLITSTYTRSYNAIHNKAFQLKKYNISKGIDHTVAKLIFEDVLTLNEESFMTNKNEPLASTLSPKDSVHHLKEKYKILVAAIYNLTANDDEAINNQRTRKQKDSNTGDAYNATTNYTKDTRKMPWHHSTSMDERTKNCKEYFDNFPAIVMHDEILNYENKTIKEPFSLAFSHMLHNDVAIFEIFLALFFRPNNFHCVHVDYKAAESVRKNVEGLVRCYKTKVNQGEIFVFSKNKSIPVHWGEMSVLDADMKCQSKLLKFNEAFKTKIQRKFQWKYCSSVAGSELPIVTYSSFHNKISTSLKNESSSVESFGIPELNQWRFDNKEKYASKTIENDVEILKFKIPDMVVSNPGEKNFTRALTFKIFKGLKNVILSARDTDFLINHQVSRQLYDWFKDTDFPEEHFLPTLIRIRVDPDTLMLYQNQTAKILYQDPGGLTYTNGDTLHGICPRFTYWMQRYDCINNIGCYGECVNSICNLHTLDLSKISDQSTDCLIANKFNLDIDPMAVTFQFFNVLHKTMVETQELKNWKVLLRNIVKTKLVTQ